MIDPSIALSIKQPQFADPLEQQGKALNLLAARQQLAMTPFKVAAAQQELEQNRLGIQKAQTAIDEEKAFKEASARNATPAELIRIAPNLALPRLKQLLDQRKSELEQAKQQAQIFSNSLGSVKYAPPEQQPAQYQAVRADLIQKSVIKPEDAPEQYDPAFVDQHFRAAIDADKQVDDKAKELDRNQRILEAAPKSAKEWMDIVEKEGSATRSQAELDQTRSQLEALGVPKGLLARSLPAMWSQPAVDQLAQRGVPVADRPKYDIEQMSLQSLRAMTPADWDKTLQATIPDTSTPLYQRTKAAVDLARSRGDLKGAQAAIKDAGDQLGRTETAVSTAKATAPIKIEVAAGSANARADAAGLSDDDYARAGEQYMRTGVMPAMGRDSITRGKIVHAGNAWARDNGLKAADVVTMQAAYQGDKESLKKFQSQRDQIVSFEQTATKNIDLMLEKAQPLVDAGSPLLNKPLRSIQRTGLGSADQAAFDAAYRVANNEVAKVTQGGGLSGVVSDSARHEIETANSPNATLGQLIAAAKVLKQDMANRHGSMDATLSDIRTRIGGGSAPPAASGKKPLSEIFK